MNELLKENKVEQMTVAFAENLRALRKESHHTQAYLANKLHITKSCVSNWEKGLRLPNPDILTEIGKIYGVTTAYLLGISKKAMPYVTEERFIDKTRYLDLKQLSAENQRVLKSFYAFLLTLEKRHTDT